MKNSKIVIGLLLLVGLWLWSILVWTEPTQLNSDSRPVQDLTKSQKADLNSLFMGNLKIYTEGDAHMTSVQLHLNEVQATQKAVQTAIEEGRRKHRKLTLQAEAIVNAAIKDVSYTYNVIVIDDCEYMKNLNGPPPAANTNYVHKGNCSNPIHPENTVDWSKMNKLLNSPMLKNILQ